MAAVPSIGRATRIEGAPAPEAALTRALYEQYANQIFRYCLHQLGSREEAEDAVQSTFLNAFRGIQRGIVPELESAWLFKIAHNVCLSRRRSTWRRGRIESPADFEVVEELAPAPSQRADELIGLQDVLEEMPENQRRAILLREWQGLSYREIAAELELSQAAVETLIFRARRALAQGLETPPQPQRRRLVRGADFGSLLAGAKSLLLGGGAAAKVAAAVAVVGATTVVAAAPVQRQVPRHVQSVRPRQHVTAAPSAPAPAAAATGVTLAPPHRPAPGVARPPAKRRAAPAAAAHGAPAVPSVASAPPAVPPPSEPPPAPPSTSSAGSQAPAPEPETAAPAAPPAGGHGRSAEAPGRAAGPPASPPGLAKQDGGPAPGLAKKEDAVPPGHVSRAGTLPTSPTPPPALQSSDLPGPPAPSAGPPPQAGAPANEHAAGHGNH